MPLSVTSTIAPFGPGDVVTLTVPASRSGVVRVRLHAVGGGTRIGPDPRVRNFRVRRCELVTASEAPKVAMNLRREFEDAPERFAGISPDERILSPGVSAVWGPGWYCAESFETNAFRWMKADSTVVLLLPGGASPWLTLDVASGPALGFRAFGLEVRDQWGEILATARVKRRSEVKVRVPRLQGAIVVSLHASGGGAPKKVPGGSRFMALRLFRVGWVAAESDAEKNIAREQGPVEMGSFGSGVWYGGGWLSIPRTGRAPKPAMFRDSEIVMRVPEGPQRTLVLDVEPAQSMFTELVVRDARDRVLFRRRIDGKQEVRLVEPVPPGGYYALRLHAKSPDRCP